MDPSQVYSTQKSQSIQQDNRSFHSESEQPHRSSQLRRHLSQTPIRLVSHIQGSTLQTPNENQSQTSHDVATVLFGTDIDVNEIEKKFERFLLQFMADNKKPYHDKLAQIRETQRFGLEVEGNQICQYDRGLYNQLIRFPAELIQIFDRIAQKVYIDLFGDDDLTLRDAQRILVNIVNLQTTIKMRELNPKDINHLVSVKGIIVRCSEIYPEMKAAFFKCIQCGEQKYIILERGSVQEPNDCVNCKGKHTFEIVHNLCTFTNKQYIKLQETPDSIPDGDTPQSITLIAYDDNVDEIKPGDQVECVGVVRAQGVRVNKNKTTLKSTFNTYLDVVSYCRNDKQKLSNQEDQQSQQFASNFNAEIKQKLYQLAEDPNIYQRLVKSFAPSIWEQQQVKKGILCQLFGGTPKQIRNQRMRNDINVLLIGDPSVAKSQLLQYVHKIAPRGIYTSGKGSSAVGLTAYISKDPDTKEIILESGALVLSDMGICCIDEFDKMDDGTRAILHEAMEQQTISIAKAGIVAQLNTRTSILAGANPVQSKYNPRKSVKDNINLPPSLISRFDLIYLMLDTPEFNQDSRLASHILKLYIKNQNQSSNTANPMETEDDVIDRETFTQYVSFARQEIKPKLTTEVQNLLVKGYVDIRRQGRSKNVFASTPRQLESIIRIAEALAKMRFAEFVEESDVEEAFRLMRVATHQAATDPTTGLIDMDLLATGITANEREKITKIAEIIKDIMKANKKLFKEQGMIFKDLQFEVMKKLGIENTEDLPENELLEALNALQEDNFVITFGPRGKKPKNIKLGSAFDE